jgi:hypothetical protein
MMETMTSISITPVRSLKALLAFKLIRAKQKGANAGGRAEGPENTKVVDLVESVGRASAHAGA